MSFHYNIPCDVGHSVWFPNILTQEKYSENIINPDSIAMMKERDNIFINKWLSQIQIKQKDKHIFKSPSMPELRYSLTKVIELCRNIKNVTGDLKKNIINLSDNEWEEKMSLVNKWKDQISSAKAWRDERVYESLKKKLAKRHCKRARLKRRKDKLRSQNILEDLVKSDKNNKIDGWLSKMKEEIDKKKKEEELKVVTDNVLRDVTRRKADSRRCLALFNALKNLREAREKSAVGRGEKLNAKNGQHFSSSIEKLESIWNFALNKYLEEEKSLGLMLKKYEDTTKENKDPVVNINNASEKTSALWKSVMFGAENAMPQRDFHGNMEHFICIRRLWDQFLCSEKEGSRLPVGWVLPPENPKSEWKQYSSEKS